MPTYEQHMKALQRAREAGDTEAMNFIRGEATKAMQAEEAARADKAERDRPFLSRAATNIGAGMMGLVQGVRDVAGDMGIGKGVSDAEIQEKRAIDDKLASQTTGGGLLQVAGEVLPTLVIPAGAGGAAARGVARVAGRALPQAAARQSIGRAALGTAAGGAAGGAVQATTDDESRLQNMAVGAAVGGAAPYVLKGAVKAGRGLKNIGQEVASGAGIDSATNAVARRALEQRLANAKIDPDAISATYKPHPLVETRPSAAVASQSNDLAMLERASRAERPEVWAPFDEANQTARWKALDDNLLTQADVDARLAKADEIGAQAPYGEAVPARFKKAMDGFYDNLQVAKTTAEYHGNPAVRAAVDAVENSMRSAGTVTPALMHQLRQTLAKGLTGVPGAGEQGVRAATKDPKIISLMQGIDDVMDYSTKYKWGQWKDDYSTAMTKAERAKADVNVRGHFVDEFGTPRTGTVGGDNGAPRVTGVQLQRAMAKHGVGKKGPKKGSNLLETGSEDVMLGVKRDLDMQDILQRQKLAGTAGGGSDTAMNFGGLARAGALELMMPGAGVTRLAQRQGQIKGQQAAAEQLARLLQEDPTQLQAVLRAIAQQQALRGTLPAGVMPGLGYAMGGALTAN